MKNIYDLLNQVEDNEDILSENERMEMTDIEKRRIYNRILLDSEEENRQEQAKKGRKAKKLLTAAACMAVICAVGFTAGAAVKEYLYKNTQSDYREKLDSTDSEAAADNTADNVIVDTADNTAENAIDGVDIRMTEVRMQEDSLTFDCTFTFDGDICCAFNRCLKQRARDCLLNSFKCFIITMAFTNTDMCNSLVLHNGGNIRKVKVNECR